MKTKNTSSARLAVVTTTHDPQLNPTMKTNRPFALLCTLILALVQVAQAETLVCGLVENQTWTLAGSPYLVTCDVQVDSLFIQPGVVVQFQSNYVFQVTGFLVATGTVAQPVLFTTTNSAVGWQGIFFNEVLSLSELKYCIIEGSKNSGARIQDCIVEISNCVFRNNSASQGGGINVNNTDAGLGESLLSNCSFSNNTASAHGGAVRANMGTSNNSIRFICCTIVDNTANPASANGDYLGGGLYITGDCEFNNCRIAGNIVRARYSSGASVRASYGGGVHLDGDGAAEFENCTITNNSSIASGSAGYGFGGGIYLASGALTNRNCIVAYNTSSGSGSDGSGIYINSGTALLQNCTVVYNSNVGLRAADNGTVVRNSILSFNAGGGTQLTGTTNIFYSCVQNGDTSNNNNIVGNPSLNPSCLRITFSSPCKDAGDANSSYNDVCIDDVNSCAPLSRGTSRNDMGAHGGPGACLWGVCGCDLFLSGPAGAAVCYGQNVTFCVTAAGCEPISYQWRLNGTPITDATNNCHTVSNVQSNNAGVYSVRVCNASGCKTNSATLVAYPACIDIRLYAGLTITGQTGHVYCVQYVNDLNSTNWISLTNFTYTGSEFFYLDRQTPFQPHRFYRVVEGPCP